jgi:hypothetical protein
VRRSTYHDVVKLADLSKLLDVTGIQTYVINAGGGQDSEDGWLLAGSCHA